ncbi:(R)-mandelonitrile lyase [Actinomycetospora termitidis]|uniref:Cupin domain-containing protein n=1 Tax=Actinomycetospora termitidis TaxID=3053470 RepID=A0ABT7MG90_9PSEU|nr:cupin domain-containing protein [Actinomycetospora sp. Odt1-22]MDL5159697.1 cupin domain-containing protein [Actinomycetospora sp. Odt1-22]
MELDPRTPTAKAPAERFTGEVYLNIVHPAREPSRLSAALVRFTPGARTNWHSHVLGQTLVCTDGEGVVVGRDGTVIRLRPGDSVWTPPGEEHWHGSVDGQLMCHYALLEGTAEGDGTTWLEPVTDDQYRQAHSD